MTNPSPLTRAINKVVDDDEELASQARALAYKAIKIANHYLDNGSPKMQLDVIRSIMPAIGRGMTDKGESDEIAKLREDMANIMQAVTGQEHVA